jgi:hypothetical protein
MGCISQIIIWIENKKRNEPTYSREIEKVVISRIPRLIIKRKRKIKGNGKGKINERRT